MIIGIFHDLTGIIDQHPRTAQVILEEIIRFIVLVMRINRYGSIEIVYIVLLYFVTAVKDSDSGDRPDSDACFTALCATDTKAL